MKRKVLSVICLCVYLIYMISSLVTNPNKIVGILDEKVPLSSGTLMRVSETEADKLVIPDKYNTGAKGELTPITSDCYISGVRIATTGGTARKLDLYYQPASVTVPSVLLIENCDFSSADFKFYNADLVEKDTQVIFRNCKFKSYTISGFGKVNHKFEQCTFTHFLGGNAEFTNCYFGGGTDGDGINPLANCTFNNCMIADLIQTSEVASSKHIDGYQIFGDTNGKDNTNIHMSNCRFELPYLPYTTASGALNCPLSIIMRYSNADNITFKDCYINGGLYYALMVVSNGNTITNMNFSNIHIGESSKSAYICDDSYRELIKNNVKMTDSLYVGSVTKDKDGIHISVTNDTSKERTLRIITENGFQDINIEACPKGINLEKDSMNYSDFPFDIDVRIDDAMWVVCYDMTDTAKQIRFLNWGTEQVFVPYDCVISEEIVDVEMNTNLSPSESEKVEESVKEDVNSVTSSKTEQTSIDGECGRNVKYSFENGVLVLSGKGDTDDYHSKKTAPWYEFRNDIKEVIVEEGVTQIGNQLFVECTNLVKVTLGDTVLSIGTNVFKRCTSIQEIIIPESLTSIGGRSFTSAVRNVKYAGTRSQWNKIEIADYNSGLLNANVSFGVGKDGKMSTGTCGPNVKWTLNEDGVLVLSGNGNTDNYHSAKVAPWFDFRNEIKEVIVEDGVSSLGNQLFVECTNLKSVYLAETVMNIGTNVFKRCTSIQDIYIPKSLKVIGGRSFTSAVRHVRYAGTYEQWNQIRIEQYNMGLLKANITYGR